MVADALVELARVRHSRAAAVELAPKVPGLYAFFGDEQSWLDLGLEPAFDDQPLYVGKAEKSLNSRDVGTHFTTGNTGSSTVRRSLAALLVDQLELRAISRDLALPDRSANYSLEPAGDERLSRWMDERLRLATWARPDGVTLRARVRSAPAAEAAAESCWRPRAA